MAGRGGSVCVYVYVCVCEIGRESGSGIGCVAVVVKVCGSRPLGSLAKQVYLLHVTSTAFYS